MASGWTAVIAWVWVAIVAGWYAWAMLRVRGEPLLGLFDALRGN